MFSVHLCLLASATSDVQRMASRDGLLLAAGGEGRLAVGHGRLLHQNNGFCPLNKTTLAICWGQRDPLDAKAEDAGGRG